ncbi:hypothetical protein BJX66DRAFT_266833 [Aspergillus keveii]|uniref:DUF7587 domain-containing protein n=1 Tax=Aspergillus keveii TaxID=714993 RepID=A0ABR4FYF5_9EURO
MTMDQFRLHSDKIPQFLYRVGYEGSATVYYPDIGLISQDTRSIYAQDDDFGDAVDCHLNWSRKRKSRFISLFSDRTHAENWMNRQLKALNNENCNSKYWNLLEIDTTALSDSYLFHAHEIVTSLDLDVKAIASASIKGEYLVVHRVPAAAITVIQPAPQDSISDELIKQLESMT